MIRAESLFESGISQGCSSWLYHWVHPYAGQKSRIAISFSATLRTLAADQANKDEDIGANLDRNHTEHRVLLNGAGVAAAAGKPHLNIAETRLNFEPLSKVKIK